jgi:hypothetical protein
VTEAEVPALRTLLIDGWIDVQICYHEQADCRLAKRHRQLTWLAVTLFGISAIVARLHGSRLLESGTEPNVWGYLSVVIPAIGTALSGCGARRENASRRALPPDGRSVHEAKELVEDSRRPSSPQRARRTLSC